MIALWAGGSARGNSFFGRFNEQHFSLNHKLFLNASWSMWRRKPPTRDAWVVLACFTTTSIKASLLGVLPSECQKYTAKKKPHTSWYIHPCLSYSSFIPKSGRNSSSFFVCHCSQVAVNCHKYSTMCTHGHPHISSHRPLKASSHPAVHIHVSPILTCFVVENPRTWCPVSILSTKRAQSRYDNSPFPCYGSK